MKLLAVAVFTLAAVVLAVGVMLATRHHHRHACTFTQSCGQHPFG
jgi:hypothetical protein